MKYNSIAERHAAVMRQKGWDEDPRSARELHMLMITEVAEATEEVRRCAPPIYQFVVDKEGGIRKYRDPNWDAAKKPEGEAIELADVALRIMHRFTQEGWDLDANLLIADAKFDVRAPSHHSPLEIHHGICTFLMAASVNENERTDLCMAFLLCEARCYQLDISLEQAIEFKIAYNKTRPYRHGGKSL